MKPLGVTLLLGEEFAAAGLDSENVFVGDKIISPASSYSSALFAVEGRNMAKLFGGGDDSEYGKLDPLALVEVEWFF